MVWDTLIKNLVGAKKIKKDAYSTNDNKVSISEQSEVLLEKAKLPFETTDDFINRLLQLKNNFYSQRGRDFINTIFNDIFLQCSGEYLKSYDANAKKGKEKEKIQACIKKSIYDLFENSDDNILTLLLIIEESITLLLQTDFFELVSNEKEFSHNEIFTE